MAGRREATSQESRRILLAAAAEVIAERGYRKATLAEIGDRAGISRGSIAWHFGSKEGLLMAVVDQMREDLRAQFSVTQPLSKDEIEQRLDFVVDYSKDPLARLIITVWAEAMEVDGPLRSNYADLHATIREELARWVTPESLPAGMTPEGWATMVLGATTGISLQWFIAPERVDLVGALAALRSTLLSGLADKEPS